MSTIPFLSKKSCWFNESILIEKLTLSLSFVNYALLYDGVHDEYVNFAPLCHLPTSFLFVSNVKTPLFK
nr:MAG TPA: hypothetical protein [Caudoviricetes sp.]